MPISAVIHLIPEENAYLPPTMGHLAHGAFLAIIKKASPELAESLHQEGKEKPFTVSPLQGKFEKVGERLLIRQGTDCWLRFALLRDELFHPFSCYFLESQNIPSIILGKGKFTLTRLVTSGEGENVDKTWSGHATYEEIMDRTISSRHIALRFYSPTAFKVRDISKGKSRNYANPDLKLCDQSWANRWNAFCPEGLRIDKARLLQFIEDHAQWLRIQTKSKMMDFGRYKELGFIGECLYEFREELGPEDWAEFDEDPPAPWEYELGYEEEKPRRNPIPWDDELLKQANILADFSFYCGTGYKTTMGMGQTRRIS